MSTYNKPYLTFQQQLDQLKTRGLGVTDEPLALDYLRRLGYYRLSGYWYPCRKIIANTATHSPRGSRRGDDFLPGSMFQDVVDLYVFDKKLKMMMLDAIERIEVSFRVEIAYLLGRSDSFAYQNPKLLHGNFTKKINRKTGKTGHQAWLEKHDDLISRSKDDFVTHYKCKYGLPLPIWVAIELWDFGLLSRFYQGMRVNDKATIASKYNVTDWQVMESWLRCMNYVRNVAAHHNRLWNRNLIDQPKLGKKGQMPDFDPFIGNINVTSRIYIALCILANMMQCICPQSSWRKRLVELIDTFPKVAHMKVADMGFPNDWKDHSFWKL